jgi:hypothetical protein
LKEGKMAVDTKWHEEFALFDDLAAFSKAVEKEAGEAVDLESVVQLNTNFVDGNDRFLILNLKDYNSDEPNNIMFFTEYKAFLFSRRPPPFQEAEAFADVLPKPFGRGTALCFLTLNKVLENHNTQLERLIASVAKMEDHFDHTEYRNLALEFERLIDKLEEFHELLLRLQERRYRQVETQYISFDYRVLIAESQSLQAKCRRRLTVLKDVRQDHEMRTTEELNERIVKLNEVMKRLTALTVILMLPTLIASHFGMNFVNMPELKIAWVYPAVIVFQLIFMGIGYLLFRRIGWL